MKLLRIGGGVLAALALLAAGCVAWVATADLRPHVEAALSGTLQRRVTIGEFHLRWRRGPSIHLRDLAIANMPGMEFPDMVRLASLDADIDWAPLLRGVLQYRRLRASGLDLVLERHGGVPNWRFPGGGGSIGHIAAVPKDRTQFPTLLDARIRDSRVRYRASSGAILDIGLADLAISAAADDQPATLVLAGSYNGTPGTVSVRGASFAEFRRAALPYRTEIGATMAGATLDFRGTLTEPLDVDGIEGELAVSARALGELLDAFGAGFAAAYPAEAQGTLHRSGNDWRLDPARGAIAGNAFSGALALAEGGRGAPDAITAGMAFDRLVLDRIAGSGGDGDVSLLLDPKAARVKARLTAAQLAWRALRLARAELRFDLRGDQAELERLSFTAWGGEMSASASLRAQGRLAGAAAMSGIDLATVAAAAGASPGEMAGRLDGRLEFDLAGPTFSAALGSGTVQAAIGMTGGRIARSVLELASADLRAAFRHAEGSVPVTCLLVVLDAHNGTGHLAPLRLRSADATLAGGGTLDLSRRAIDLTIRSEQTGFFALDVPIRISGPIASPGVAPAAGAPPPGGLPGGLGPTIQQLAGASPCAR